VGLTPWILLTVACAPDATVLFSQREAPGQIAVLSAGAVEEGVRQLSQRYRDATGQAVAAEFGTGPEVEKRLAATESGDILIAPVSVIDRAAKAGRIVTETARPLARVGVGITVRRGAEPPDASSVEALEAALIAADSVVYNQASTGQYLEGLFGRMGILERLKPKTTRYGSAAQVLEHVIAGSGNEIGFGPITEIKSFESKGAVLVAPLPRAVQHFTTYVAVVLTQAASRERAQAFIEYLTSASAREIFAETGAQ
jgi:molybdate transport system substrate-binding protein